MSEGGVTDGSGSEPRRRSGLVRGAALGIALAVIGVAAWAGTRRGDDGADDAPDDAAEVIVPAQATPRPIQPVGGPLQKALRVTGAPTPVAGRPTTPPAQICGNAQLLTGPAAPPAGAVVVAAGNNGGVDFSRSGTTYWFAPGLHTLGASNFDQIIAGTNSTYIGGPGAILDGQNRNLYAFTQQATGVAVRFLTIRNFGTGLSNNNEGVVNHDAGNNWTIENNTIMNNDGAGIFVGDGNVIRNNCLRDNGQYGLSAYEADGVTSVVVDRNEILHNNTDNWEARIEGCGCTGGAKFWDVSGAVITNNWVKDNLSVGLWADTNNRDFIVEGNWFEGNQDEAFWYEVSYNARIRYNVFVRNALVKGREFAQRGDNFPVATVYLSEAGGDPRVVGPGSIDISYNLFQDNWSGVTLWENADRYCNSPANTSSDYCALGGAATLQTCVAGTIARQPYYNDCRWKTQNVAVHDNEFRVNPAAIGCINNWCARQAVLSNFGTFPSWSPYQGEVIRNAITFNQNNRWSSNTYVGPWQFLARDTETTIGWNAWRAAPYNQDPSSTIG